jgi:tRNA pseudouridine55 synthase
MNKIIVVDKPYGLTSSFVVNKLKKFFGAEKAGHSGTLDPLATGVLVVYFDEMTKIIPYIDESIKNYEVKILLGLLTDTLDISGKILNLSKIKKYSNNDIIDTIESFKGEYNYKPPIFSAIKINGIPSYKLARDGKCVELAIKKSYIEEIKIINSGFSTLNLRIESSKGTYIRALARDIGLALGSFGTVSKLRRTKTGRFDIKTSNNFFALMNGSEPLFFPIDKLFTVINIKESDVIRISSEKNFKDVNLGFLLNINNQDSPVILSCSNIPILIATNKFDSNGAYISSKIKFFNKKN